MRTATRFSLSFSLICSEEGWKAGGRQEGADMVGLESEPERSFVLLEAFSTKFVKENFGKKAYFQLKKM